MEQTKTKVPEDSVSVFRVELNQGRLAPAPHPAVSMTNSVNTLAGGTLLTDRIQSL